MPALTTRCTQRLARWDSFSRLLSCSASNVAPSLSNTDRARRRRRPPRLATRPSASPRHRATCGDWARRTSAGPGSQAGTVSEANLALANASLSKSPQTPYASSRFALASWPSPACPSTCSYAAQADRLSHFAAAVGGDARRSFEPVLARPQASGPADCLRISPGTHSYSNTTFVDLEDLADHGLLRHPDVDAVDASFSLPTVSLARHSNTTSRIASHTSGGPTNCIRIAGRTTHVAMLVLRFSSTLEQDADLPATPSVAAIRVARNEFASLLL